MRCVIALLSLFFITSCVTTPELSPQQRRAMQSRTFENTNMDNVFRSFKTVLQDEGYVIKNQDMLGGLIVAEILKTDSSSAIWAALSGTNVYRIGQSFEVSVNLEEINKILIETRLVVQEKSHMSLGGSHGHEILDPKLYEILYQKISTEIERRKAQGKG